MVNRGCGQAFQRVRGGEGGIPPAHPCLIDGRFGILPRGRPGQGRGCLLALALPKLSAVVHSEI